MAVVAVFVLKIHIAFLVILLVLFIIDTALLCGWNYILPKILPESWLQLIGCETNVRQKNKSETKNKKEIPELEDGNEKESETESDKGSDEGSEKKDKDDEDEL